MPILKGFREKALHLVVDRIFKVKHNFFTLLKEQNGGAEGT